MLTKSNGQTKTVFIKYYQSHQFETELRLPEKPNFHHFRFEYFSKRRRFRRLRDIVSDKETLRIAIAKECPRNVFFSPLKWLDPINVRRTKGKSIKDYMLSSPLYFDVDRKLIPERTLAATIENTQKLINYIEDKAGRKPSWTVFSGSEGFHIYYWKWDDIPRRYGSPEKRIETFVKSRKQILTEFSKKKIVVDTSVTADPWRILRVPGTLHGDTCLIAKLFDTLSDFSIEKTMLGSYSSHVHA